MELRPARADDAAALDEICLRTGADGADATARFLDPLLLAAVYVGPYLAFEPAHAFVLSGAVAVHGGVQGYVLGALDTAAFERRCERAWWPGLRARYPPDLFPADSADAGIVRLLHAPAVADRAVLANYPSHLHIDLLPGAQGAGHGRRLIERELASLARAGSTGVHVVVSATNAGALAFYARTGFAELARGDGSVTLGQRLDRGGRPTSRPTRA